MPALTREEKEKMVIQLYEENKTIREIAKVVHMNFSDIKKIIDRHTGVNQHKAIEVSKTSEEVKALILFKKNYKPVEVSIKLKVPLEEVNAIYAQYLHCKGLGELVEVYEKMKPCLETILELHKVMEKYHMGTRDILTTIKSIIDNPFIDFDISYSTRHIQDLEEQEAQLTKTIARRQEYLNSMNGYQSYNKYWQPPNPWFQPPNW